jgi:proteasome lid subunit RPN8/RPN11
VKSNPSQATQKSDLPAKDRRSEKHKRLALRFSPTAWAKLLYFRDKSDNEVGGFGITEPDDLLTVIDFVTVTQEVTAVSVKFDDEAVGDFFETQVDLGRKPEQFARIWLHSHPGDSPEPSIIDEETFKRVFGNCEWALLFVVAQNNKTYAKLKFNVGPGGQLLIRTEVDYSRDFGPSDHELWDAEYSANVKRGDWLNVYTDKQARSSEVDLSSYALPYDFLEEFEDMEPAERQFILDELAGRPELWDEEKEVMVL